MKAPKFISKENFYLIIGLLFSACMTAIAYIFDETAGIVCVFLFAVYSLFVVFYIFFEKRGNKDQDAGKTIASHTFDYLSKVDYPALLVDNDGKISWFNTAYKAVYHETVIKNGEQYKPVDVGFDSLESLKKSDATVKIVRGERHFDLKSYQIETAHKKFQLIIWYDTTELFLANTELKNANVLVAYIVVDNISEISQGLQDKYHETGIKISKILDEWATSVHGIIKEYERDKYILFFEERYIETQISNKFEILDKISELSEDGAGGIPLTVSIGISRIHGSLQEKENTAKMALQLALQRGGAQAVIKTETDNDIYGGRTKTIQKLTKIKSRVIASKLVYEIKNSTNILIMAHKAPDFDALAACVGMARLVMYHKKKVNIVTDFSNVSLGIAKKLISNLKEYDDIFVDAVFGQDLLTPDTLLLIVDASNPAVFESPPIFQNASRIAIIDHHRQASEFKKEPFISYIEPTASSASELVSEILEYALPPMTIYKEESELLLAGILLDTQNFSRNVGIRTFGAAVYLRSEGANPGKSQALFKYQLNEFKKLAEFERNIMIFRSIFAISQYELDNEEENLVVAARAADRMLQIEGIKACFALSLVGETIHISARSDGNVNVGLILEKLKGGGHYDSAGAKLYGTSIKQALVMLREAIINYCEKN